MRKLAYGVTALVLALCTPVSKAAAITYTYTGNHYTGAAAPYSTDMAVTGSFTFASPLDPNILFPAARTPTAWSISDGVMTVTNATGSLAFNVGTNALGNITMWDFGTSFSVSTGILFITSQNGSPTSFFPCGTGNTACDGVSGVAAGRAVGLAGVVNNPGTWTMTSIPEPSSLSLIIIGMFAVALIVRTRYVPVDRPDCRTLNS